ncbi:hypothetical protein [Rathayibacter tanaceti]|uniref:Uncharacterized protein n=2 Tax=Rathayibacter tanaceti TaxID=1671680 RepID=A0A162F959_9MICO|nr:hypothetical protein [Rathayibacter tanaceti]KZX20743.1 hypothetical protein ACH61_02134 [Rathayibacter tanaceti]QHC56373.1 hypothetical protein GSU10_12515 [Rathayibacter tanaceti]TCO34901.1 hypothetical protein EV639_11055 [Rathayibacter tanaceti]
MRSRLAILGLGITAVGVILSFGWSIWIIRDALLLWSYCPATALDGALERVVWSFVWMTVAVGGSVVIARFADRKLAGWFAIAFVVVALVPLGILYFLGSSALTPDIAASWLSCGVTDAVANTRALALALPAVGLGGAGVALLMRAKRLRLLVSLVVGLAAVGGWIIFLLAVVRS